MRKQINLIARWGLLRNWHANRKNRIYLRWKQLAREGAQENNQNQDMRENTDWNKGRHSTWKRRELTTLQRDQGRPDVTQTL